jgi:hypothetical protein
MADRRLTDGSAGLTNRMRSGLLEKNETGDLRLFVSAAAGWVEITRAAFTA